LNSSLSAFLSLIKNGDDESLAEGILKNNCLKSVEHRRTNSGIITARVPKDAHKTLAEGEFNR
jgi:predicted HicB family RNase H-like nuclease